MMEQMDPCAFVMSVDPDTGKQNGMAATWLTMCSHEPPVWAVSMGEHSHTLDLIRRSGEFVLAFATPELQDAFALFGATSGAERDADKIAAAGIETASTPSTRLPLLLGAHANLVCRLANIVPCGGTYSMVFGNVIESHHNPGSEQLYYTGRDADGHRTYAATRRSVARQF